MYFNSEDSGDTVLVFVTRDYWLRPHISRVLTHARAVTLYRQHLDPATGRIPEGCIPSSSILGIPVYVYKASAIGLTSELTDRLLSLSVQFVDRNGWFETDASHRDWQSQWDEARITALPLIPAYSP